MQILNRYVRNLLLIGLFFCGLNSGSLKAQTPGEEQVKAAFLFNFTQFIKWPDRKFSSPEAPLVICIYGDNPFDTFLDELVQGEKAAGRPIVVKYLQTIEELDYCHILYIEANNRSEVRGLLEQARDKSVLTVGDSQNFIRNGGIIRFMTVNNKLRFQINAETAKSASIDISSKVLRLAEITNTSYKPQ